MRRKKVIREPKWFKDPSRLQLAICIPLAALFLITFVYFMATIAKNGSYMLFYEDMVKATVIEMVNPESLIK